MPNTKHTRSLIAGIAGFLVYGGWAYYINEPYAMGATAGLTQGSYSFALTMTTTLFMEYLFDSLKGIRGRSIATVAITSLITFSTAYGIHWFVGTPMILVTILPGFVIGSVYTAVYVTSLTTALQEESCQP